MRKQTASYQPGSAVREANRATLQHGETSRVDVVVGMTPEEAVAQPGEPTVQAAHFCSSRISVIQRHVRGDGNRVPECQTVIRGGVPAITQPSIVRFRATATSNGCLSLKNVADLVAVPVPASLIERAPWAYEGGSEEVAAALGCNSLDEMFETHGEPVTA